MPDQFGNPTPTEVLQKIADDRDQLMEHAGSGQHARLTNMFVLGKLMTAGVTPAMLNAKKVEGALRDAQADPRAEGETEIDYQLRVGRSLYDKVKEFDPNAAAKVLEHTRTLEKEQLNRSVLMQQQEAGKIQIEQARREQTMQKDFEETGYVMDMSTGKVLGQVPLDDPDYQKKVAKIRGDNPMITDVSYKDMMRLVEDTNSVGKQVSVQQFGKLAESLDSNYKMAVTSGQLAEIVAGAWQKNGQNTLSDLSEVTSKVNRAVGSVNEAKAWYYGPDGHSLQSYMTSGSGKELMERARNRGITYSLLTGLAYMMAQARNDRVTDADLEAAYKMLGGEGGDVRGALDVIDEQLRNNQLVIGSSETSIYGAGGAGSPEKDSVWSHGQFGILDSKYKMMSDATSKTRAQLQNYRENIFNTSPPSTPTGPTAQPTQRAQGARNFVLKGQ